MQFSSSLYFPVVWTEWREWNPGLNSEPHSETASLWSERGSEFLLCKLKERWGLFVTATGISWLIHSHLYNSGLMFDFSVNSTCLSLGSVSSPDHLATVRLRWVTVSQGPPQECLLHEGPYTGRGKTAWASKPTLKIGEKAVFHPSSHFSGALTPKDQL